MPSGRDSRRRQTLRRYEARYERLKAEILDLGYVLQGSLVERWMECGQAGCRCHRDPQARHGPYYQWSWKRRGRTLSVYLDIEQAALCGRWIANHRRLERTLRGMRTLSLRAARLYEIPRKPPP
jgi:hypothetical protein